MNMPKINELKKQVKRYAVTHPGLIAALAAPVLGAAGGAIAAADSPQARNKVKTGAMLGAGAGAGILAYQNRDLLKKLIYNIVGPK